MINIFSHYIPTRSLVLAALEAAVLLIAVQVGMSLEFAGSHAEILGSSGAMLSHASAFALGMIIIMSSMGLYQTDLWNNTQSVRLRVVIAFAVAFAIVGVVAYLMPARYPSLVALGAVIVLLFWLYITFYILLLGAEVNAELELQTEVDTTKGPAKPMGTRGAFVADRVAGGPSPTDLRARPQAPALGRCR